MFFRLMQLIKPIFPSLDLSLIRLSMFHDKRGPVFVTLKTITELLKKHQINYAVVGGIAVYKHGYERSTNDWFETIFPDPKTCCEFIDGHCIISLPKLIELKLASCKTLPIGRSKDKADVVELIKAKNLDKSFAGLLHPYVRSDFIDIVDGLEREKM